MGNDDVFQGARMRKAIHAAMAISAARVGKRKKKGGASAGWSFVCACGSIDDGDNKRADVSPRGLLCFPILSFSSFRRFFFVSARVPLYFFVVLDRHRGLRWRQLEVKTKIM